MLRRILVLTLILAAVLVPAGIALADYTKEECADGQWEVRPNQTLYFIAYTCGVKVDALVAYNNIPNPNLINTGQILLIPPADFQPGGVSPPAATPAPSAPSTPVGSGLVSAAIGDILYSGDGRTATVQITVGNNGVQPAVAGGRYYPPKPGEEGKQWVTLIGAVHGTVPYPEVHNEPLWKTMITTNDGLVFPAYVGCIYHETIFAAGDEPLSRADNIWFHWEVTLEGGWFDCGNAYQVKPEDLKPGQSGSAPLTVYLVHPRQWAEGVLGTRKIVRITLEVFDINGKSLGIVASRNFN